MFTLLIKGTIVDAERALCAHGFHPSDWLTQPTIAVHTKRHVTSTVNVKSECEPGVIRWFAEIPAEPPFPVGTLLHYSGAHSDVPAACECDNTHDQNGTVCRFCWAHGRRKPSDPELYQQA